MKMKGETNKMGIVDESARLMRSVRELRKSGMSSEDIMAVVVEALKDEQVDSERERLSGKQISETLSRLYREKGRKW